MDPEVSIPILAMKITREIIDEVPQKDPRWPKLKMGQFQNGKALACIPLASLTKIKFSRICLLEQIADFIPATVRQTRITAMSDFNAERG